MDEGGDSEETVGEESKQKDSNLMCSPRKEGRGTGWKTVPFETRKSS